ncbi:MAG TPA: multiheme c-type cytochrome, partial [Nannocystaceae bacterium]|nr:multiheme c-type cytochrome [Nannocystaceae bacterium]
MEPAKIVGLFALAALAGLGAFARIDHAATARVWVHARAVATPGLRGREAGYVGSQRCRACHASAWESWHGSFHRTMTQLAAPEVVLARAATMPDGSALERTESGARWLPGGGGAPRPIVMTTGAHHMQIYWTPAEGGVLQALPYAWLVDDARFVPNEATLLRPPDDGSVYTWNRVCIRCHAVAGSPGWDERTNEVDTRVAELGIACEACHGPGRRHADAYALPWSRMIASAAEAADAMIVQPADLVASATNDVCGQCHGISVAHDEAQWLRHGSSHAPPQPLAQTSTLVRHPARADQALLDEVLADDADFLVDRFWPDGMVRVTGRELNGLVESRCHDGGELSCLSCHSMHDSDPNDQIAADRDGDGACTQCHAAERWASPTHTHHASASEGARCLNCHMPRTSWGLLGAVRSHEIDSPSATTSVDVGRPDACSLCHLDRSLDWTAGWLHRWYGQPRPDEIAPAGDDALSASAAVRWLLAGDAGQRAIAAWHMAWPPALVASGSSWQSALLVELFDDPYPAVRLVAQRSIAA